VNGGYTRALADAALARGETDLVSFAASFLANPDLPARLARSAPLNPPEPATFYGGDHRGYTDYPALDQGLAA
jgi:N-ethylmaleimide reductase